MTDRANDPSNRWADDEASDDGASDDGDGEYLSGGGTPVGGESGEGGREGAVVGNRGPVFDGGSEPAPEEMSLEELREEIEAIDRELVELIARRTYVADTIADVKAEQGLPTTDESQEEAVMERAGRNAEQFDVDANLVKAIFRLLIELNKVEQRERR